MESDVGNVGHVVLNNKIPKIASIVSTSSVSSVSIKQKVDPENPTKPQHSLLRLWLEDYCTIYCLKQCTVKESSEVCHRLVGELLIKGDENPLKYKSMLNKKEEMFKHEELINAVMVQIKPGILQMFCQHYDVDMLSKYFTNLKYKQYEQQMLLVASGINTPHDHRHPFSPKDASGIMKRGLRNPKVGVEP